MKDQEIALKRGDKVRFKGNRNFKELPETYIWAVGHHGIISYYIQHPDGNITKEYMASANTGDGFEQPHSSEFKEGLKYIWVMPEEIESLQPIQEKEITGSCPCLYLEEPCHEKCSCVNKFSSVGCANCCTYGSLEQRKAMAKHLDQIRRGFPQ